MAACLILATAAFAAVSHWGLFDFLNQGAGSGTLSEAAEIVATDPPQEGGAGNWLPSGCAKPYNDGEYVYMVVDATPADGLLLLGPGLLPPDAMRNLTKEDSDAMTIGEYAGENDLHMAIVGISTRRSRGGRGRRHHELRLAVWKRTARWCLCSAARRRRAQATRLRLRFCAA